MAGAFSGHLLNTFNNVPQQPSVITSGAMSFDARSHGTPGPVFSHSRMPQSLFGFTPLSEDSTSAKHIATLQAKLNKKLGPEYISQRPGPGGGPKLTYAEGWKIINLANEVFGFNGWSSNIVSIATDFVDFVEESRRFNVGVTAIVRVTLRDGTYHEDVGYGMLENAKSKAGALDKCKKEAVTDALKRTLRNFGNLLGNCLYDKSYAQEVVKIKIPPAKFNKSELYRRPEFEEGTSGVPPPGQPMNPEPSTRNEEVRVKVEHGSCQPETPVTYVPRHLRQEMAAAAQHGQAQTPARVVPTLQGASSRSPAHTATSGLGPDKNVAPKADAPKSSGLAAPIQTPMQAQRPFVPRAPATSPLSRVRSAPCAEPVPLHVPDDAGPPSAIENTGQCNNRVDDDDDGFPLSTQDGVLFAAVDLADLGRPIDYDEGASAIDASALERDPELLPQRHHQTCAQLQSVAKPPSGGGQGKPQLHSSATASTPTSSTSRQRPAMTTSAGGSHLPPGPESLVQQHAPRPVVPACVRTNLGTPQSGQHNVLKRNADMMQSGPASSTRPPAQGLGLAQRQQQQQQRDAITPRPSDHCEGNDLKRVKR